VTRWVWAHQSVLGGMSFFPADDAAYEQAPYVEITREEYERLAAAFPPIDHAKLVYYEDEDLTTAAQELACVRRACARWTTPGARSWTSRARRERLTPAMGKERVCGSQVG
jgi:hypothetical protein